MITPASGCSDRGDVQYGIHEIGGPDAAPTSACLRVGLRYREHVAALLLPEDLPFEPLVDRVHIGPFRYVDGN